MRFVAIMSEIGEGTVKNIIVTMGETLMLLIILMKNLLFFTLKSFGSVVVILLEKELFKIYLLVSVLYLPWVVLFFIELVVLWMLSLCL